MDLSKADDKDLQSTLRVAIMHGNNEEVVPKPMNEVDALLNGFRRIEAGGFKKGELVVFAAGKGGVSKL